MSNQKEICEKHNVVPFLCQSDDKLGIAIETIGQLPINGLRHSPENGTCGWYIWCGEELGKDTDFFKPLHVSHIENYIPEIKKYLALPPGYRFLVAGDYEDVWYDPNLVCD